MFSSIFGKRRSSPVEENDVPPIPGARGDDSFVVVNPTPNSPYPSLAGMGNPSSPSTSYQRPAPPAPLLRGNSTDTFHYLQGVPFTLSKELQLANKKDTYAIEIGDVLSFAAKKMNVYNYDYDFSVEKSVLRECS